MHFWQHGEDMQESERRYEAPYCPDPPLPSAPLNWAAKLPFWPLRVQSQVSIMKASHAEFTRNAPFHTYFKRLRNSLGGTSLCAAVQPPDCFKIAARSISRMVLAPLLQGTCPRDYVIGMHCRYKLMITPANSIWLQILFRHV